MLTGAFKEREKALEDEFYYQVDQRLLNDLRSQLAASEQRKHLAITTGFTDERLLGELVDLGVSTEALAAIALAPLVLVAWADGTADAQERGRILETARTQNVQEGSPAEQLLLHWLDNKPDRKLLITWQHYMAAVTEEMSPDVRSAFRADVLERAKAVATASGGSLGFGSIAPAEERVIAKLADALPM